MISEPPITIPINGFPEISQLTNIVSIDPKVRHDIVFTKCLFLDFLFDMMNCIRTNSIWFSSP